MDLTSLIGKNIDLVPLEQKIYPLLQEWLSDSDIIKFLDDSECNLNINQLEQTYPINDQKNAILFSIVDKKSKSFVGICGFQKIDFIQKNGFLRIIIGNKNFWDGKTALESEKLLLKFAFSKLEFAYVYSIINPKNIGQIMLVERLGMKKDKVLPNFITNNSKSIDAYKYIIFANNFNE